MAECNSVEKNCQYLPSYLMGETDQDAELSASWYPPKIASRAFCDKTVAPRLRKAAPMREGYRSPLAPTKFVDNKNKGRRSDDNNKKKKHMPMGQERYAKDPPKRCLFDLMHEQQSGVASGARVVVSGPYFSPLMGNGDDWLETCKMSTASTVFVPPMRSDKSSASSLSSSKRFWVTVFGFSSGALASLLEQLSDCGTIVEKLTPNQHCNWMHLCFAARSERDGALKCNGMIVDDDVMVGVMRCTDARIVPQVEEAGRNGSSDASWPKMRSLEEQSRRNAKYATGPQSARAQSAASFLYLLPYRLDSFFDKVLTWLGW